VVGEDGLPDCLTRIVGHRGFEGALNDVAREAGFAGKGAPLLSASSWSCVADLLESREDGDERLFVAAPATRAVFATFDVDDQLPGNAPPQSAFLQRIETDHGQSMSVADHAVHRLATEDRPKPQKPVRTKVLLCYRREAAGAARFPVPPDAGWNPRFRAVQPGSACSCGRTFPDGATPEEHSAGTAGENEVVHPNEGIPCTMVYVISLGKTSRAGG